MVPGVLRVRSTMTLCQVATEPETGDFDLRIPAKHHGAPGTTTPLTDHPRIMAKCTSLCYII